MVSSFKDEWASVPELGKAGGPQQKLVSTNHPPPDTRAPLPIRESFQEQPFTIVAPPPVSPHAIRQRSPSPVATPGRGLLGPPSSRQALGFTPSSRQSLDSSFNRFHTISPAPRPPRQAPHPGYTFYQDQQGRLQRELERKEAQKPDTTFLDAEERLQRELQRKEVQKPDTTFLDAEERLQRELEKQEEKPRPNTFFVDQEERLQRELEKREKEQAAPPIAPASQPYTSSLAQPRQSTGGDGASELERKQRQLKRVQEFLKSDDDAAPRAPESRAAPQGFAAPPRPQADPARDEAMHRSLREGSNAMLYVTSIYPSDRNLGRWNEWEVRREAKERLEAATEHNEAQRRLKELHDVKMRNLDERISALQVELDDSHRNLEAEERVAEKCIAREAEVGPDTNQTRAHLAAWEQQCLSSWHQTERNLTRFAKVANGHLGNTKRTMVHYLGHVDDSNRTMSEALHGLLLIDRELEDTTVSW